MSGKPVSPYYDMCKGGHQRLINLLARAEAKGKTFTVQDRKPDGFNCNSFANHMLGVFGV